MENYEDRLYDCLAIFDTRDGSELAELVRSAREGYERADMGEDDPWREFDSRLNKYNVNKVPEKNDLPIHILQAQEEVRSKNICGVVFDSDRGEMMCLKDLGHKDGHFYGYENNKIVKGDPVIDPNEAAQIESIWQ